MDEKRCPKCEIYKGLEEFFKDRSRMDGLNHHCKECRQKEQRAYKQTDVGKRANRKNCQNYRKTEAGKEASRRSSKKKRQLYPEKIKARQAVRSAIRSGKLIRPSICESCFKKRFIQAHHEDYSKPLDVDWLCTECHNELRKKAGV